MDLRDVQYPIYQPLAFADDDPLTSLLSNFSDQIKLSRQVESTKATPVAFHFPHEKLGETGEIEKICPDLKTGETDPFSLHPLEPVFTIRREKELLMLKDFSCDWIKNAKPIEIKVENLQVAKVHPWGEIAKETNPPRNIMYELGLPNPELIPFQDPCEHETGILVPLELTKAPKPDPWNPAVTLESDPVVFPETPSYERLLLMLPTEPEGNSKESTGDSGKSHDDSPSSSVRNDKDEPTANVDLISVEMPRPMDEMLQNMESLASECFQQLINCEDLPTCVEQLRNYKSIDELDPGATRHYLMIFDKSKKSNKSGGHRGPVLRWLLKLHGLLKAIDVLLELGYEEAYDCLYEFQQRHGPTMKCDFKALLAQLANLKTGRESLHPKLVTIGNLVLEHVAQDDHHKVWIRTRKDSRQIRQLIDRFLATSGLRCATVDPDVGFDDREPIFVSADLPADFPFHVLTLVLHWHWPTAIGAPTSAQISKIAQRAVALHRPVSTGTDEPSPEPLVVPETQESIPVVVEDSLPFPESQGSSDAVPEVEESRTIVVSSSLERLLPFLEKKESLQIRTVDYSFLEQDARHQPDILVDPLTAILVIAFQDLEQIHEIRMRIRMMNLKCATCWLIAVLESASQQRLLHLWTPLVSLAVTYQQVRLEPFGTPFQLRLRLAYGYEQASSIVADVASGALDAGANKPSPDANLTVQNLLRFPFFNLWTAHLATERATLSDLIDEPVESLGRKMARTFPVQLIDALREAVERAKDRDESEEASSSYGHLGVSYQGDGSWNTPSSPKRVRFDASPPCWNSVDLLILNWDVEPSPALPEHEIDSSPK